MLWHYDAGTGTLPDQVYSSGINAALHQRRKANPRACIVHATFSTSDKKTGIIESLAR